MKKKDNFWGKLKSFWHYVWHDDSFLSYILSFLFALVIIKYLIFPGLGFLLSTDYPVVAIVSGSMEHKIVDNIICDKRITNIDSKSLSLNEYWQYCGNYYETNFNLTKDDFIDFRYTNGLNIGDVMVLYGKDTEDIDVGETLVFKPLDERFFAANGPVIHRVVDKWQDENGKWHFKTKGDHNPRTYENFEENIPEENVFGTAIFRVPYLGYFKIILVNLLGLIF
ncbi:MAG: signal peptidase I [Nanoarchaeota archaeon]